MTPSPSVLLVDDESDFRASLGMLLALEGFHVAEAADGHEALRFVGAAPAPLDAILLDYRMPGLHGGEVAQRLRERGVRTCLILVSAVADLDGIARRYRFDYAVPKPCDVAELTAAIRRCAAIRAEGAPDALPS